MNPINAYLRALAKEQGLDHLISHFGGFFPITDAQRRHHVLQHFASDHDHDLDPDYLTCVRSHPRLLVVNRDRDPAPGSYVVVHTNACRFITRLPSNGHRWTDTNVKTCGPCEAVRPYLDGLHKDGVDVRYCPFCHAERWAA